MTAYLDPVNRAFADTASQGVPVYTKPFREARDVLESIQKHDPAKDIRVEELNIPVKTGNVKTYIYRPVAADAKHQLPVIFYTHGGGWILGSPHAHELLVEDLARLANAAVVFPYYTPAPEKQYPVQFEESYGALEHIVKNGNKHNLVADRLALAGDSVGHMAIALTQLAQSRKPYLSEKTMDWMIDAFLPNPEDRRQALTSPLAYTPDEVLAKFPPTTIFVSGVDPLIAEGEEFGQRLQKAGVDVAILKAEGQIHDYVLLEPVRKSATARAVVELAALKLGQAISQGYEKVKA
ncbi:Uncharacterized protein TPAR_01261 [Tolypocladium paradoxum]|uniref:Alpha/beta hydrolase fold-3 domain-containing protein n=1 Tax=Tolypocladium paradoxum TaxID=94208 RepID=A0A2S4L7X2_9HYPO|nr:Uncharacterized protein TPAR_01261 [Tolypocladium paradoxum]